MSKWLRKGDKVIVIAGNEKGNVGEILRVQGDFAVIEGLNFRTKHMKPTQDRPKGEILRMEAPMHISNVQPCDASSRRLKLRIRLGESGERDLVYQEGDKELVYRSVRKAKT